MQIQPIENVVVRRLVLLMLTAAVKIEWTQLEKSHKKGILNNCRTIIALYVEIFG